MRVDLHFLNASPKLREALNCQRRPIQTRSIREAERLITFGLVYAQAVRITVWYPRGGYTQGRTNRKLWHGILHEVVPGLVTKP